jgi:Holliday junction resolvase RusA-like endonuclease
MLREPNEKGVKNQMSKVIEFFHEFVPPTATAQQRRHTRRGTYQPANVLKAAATLRAVFERHAPTVPILGPVRLGLVWTFPQARKAAGMPAIWMTKRPDIDNLMKLALDAMTAANYWGDDCQVVDLHTAKFVGEITGLSVCVEVLEVAP